MYPVYELIVSFFRRWGVLEWYPSSRGFLMYFLELVRAKEGDHPSLGEFLRFYDSGEGEAFYVPADGTDAVRVATVHKAKGLEYRVVILPFFTLGLERGGASGVMAPKYVLRNVDQQLALYHFNETHTKFSMLADEEYVQEKMLGFFNELNNAYVALTRAVCEMYVFIPPKSGNARNMALEFVPKEMLAVGHPADDYPRDKARDSVLPVEVCPPQCRDWLNFLKDEFIDAGVPGREGRDLGIALHEALADPEAPASDHVRGLLKDFLSAPSVRPLFREGDGRVYTEYEVVDRYGRTRRIDRLIVGEDRVTVVDFKTSRSDDLHACKGGGLPSPLAGVTQVREYIRLLREVFPGKEFRGFLAYIIDKEVVDVEDIHG